MDGDKGHLIWTVTRCETDSHHITYTVVNPERTFTVDVQCSAHDESHTEAVIAYNFIGLTDSGNETSEHSAEQLFRSDLKDWQTAINHYLKTGKPSHHGSDGHGESHQQHESHDDRHSESDGSVFHEQ